MEKFQVVYALLLVGLISVTDTQNRESDVQTLDGVVTDERETVKGKSFAEARQDSEIPTEHDIHVKFPEHQSKDLNEDDDMLKTLHSFLPAEWARTLERWLKYDLTYKGRSTSPKTTTTPTTTKSSPRCRSTWWRRRRRRRSRC